MNDTFNEKEHFSTIGDYILLLLTYAVLTKLYYQATRTILLVGIILAQQLLQ
jgi:hypothetical protein